MMTFLALYVVSKALYNLINVELIHQGHWYFPLSIIVFNMMVVRLLSFPKEKLLLSIMAILMLVILANNFMDLKRGKWYRARHVKIFSDRKRMLETLRTQYNGVGILEFEDGIISYSLGIPAMNGFGFTLDYEAHQAKQQGQLLDVAYQRGFQVLASNTYLYDMSKEAQENGNILKEYLVSRILPEQELANWNFSFLYKDQKTGVIFITFFPKS